MAAGSLTVLGALYHIASWIIKGGGSTAAKFAIESAKFLAKRALFIFIFCVALPIVLHNVLSSLFLNLMEWSIGYMSGIDNLGVMTIELTSLGAWIGQQIGIHECLSLYMSAIATRLVLELAKGLWYTTSLGGQNWYQASQVL